MSCLVFSGWHGLPATGEISWEFSFGLVLSSFWECLRKLSFMQNSRISDIKENLVCKKFAIWKKFILSVVVVGNACTMACVWWSEDLSYISPSTKYVPGIKLRPSVLVTIVFLHWAILKFAIFKKDLFLDLFACVGGGKCRCFWRLGTLDSPRARGINSC